MVMLMTIVGGITRLTGSGLSITQWQVISGILPPISEVSWYEMFDKYKLTPEFININYNMKLEKFKFIFMIEYIHRILGRLTGLILALPFCYFSFKKYFSKTQFLQLLFILLLVGFQGFVGWYMVRSGLISKPSVSPYRLALHLLTAVIIYGLLLWKALNLNTCHKEQIVNKSIYNHILLGLVVIFIQIISGAFVAGNDAGLVYNSFPMMDGELIPDGLWSMKPWYLNIFENITMVQFNHRFIALITFIILCSLYFRTIKLFNISLTKNAMKTMLLMLFIQGALGIITLIYRVPMIAASIHQLGALLLFGAMINILYSCKKDK
jgi:cytochrome c oxidase assembly protein subunit 15